MISKKNLKRAYVMLIAVLIGVNSFAQSLPEINYRDYGFYKQVKQVSTMYYSLDEGSIDKVEMVTRNFNKAGNLVSFDNKSYLDDSWSKSTVSYKGGKAFQQIWKSSNPYLSRTYTYKYDNAGKVIQQDIKFKDLAKSYINYSYKNGLMYQITAYIEGIKSVSTHYYTAEKELYKTTHRQLETGKSDIISHSYCLEGKEILSYVAPNKDVYVNAYLGGAAELKLKIMEGSAAQEKVLQSILRFEKDAESGKLPFGIQEHSEQTLQFYRKQKNGVLEPEIDIFIRNNQKDVIAQGVVDPKTKKLTAINFTQIIYANGSTSGATIFDNQVQAKLQSILGKYNF